VKITALRAAPSATAFASALFQYGEQGVTLGVAPDGVREARVPLQLLQFLPQKIGAVLKI
jgi:hypothetical protein